MTEGHDQSFQFPEVRVVEASAGSGKTYALARRYIQLLLHPAFQSEAMPVRQILALTFTNKAAFEMKARILEFLKLIALKRLPDIHQKTILEPIGLQAETAAPRAFAVMETIIHHYNFFQVQTIDKFINALLSGCAFKIGLTAHFRIRTNAREYLQYSLDELIDKARADKTIAGIFSDFLHNYLYLENRTGWFPKEDMLAICTNLFHQNNTYGQVFLESGFTSEDLVKQKKKLFKEMQTLNEIMPDGVHATFRKSLEKFLNRPTPGFDIDSISDYFAREEIPVRKNVDVPSEVDGLWQTIHRDLQGLCDREAYALFNPYIRIFHRVLEEFYAAAAKDDVLFLGELNKRAGALFDEDYVTVEELYYRLATRFRHYLIDEFQDTSRLQWHNLAKMAEEALSTGGTLFYVGDRKQAIYGFRGGATELFDEIKQDFGAFGVQVESLVNNWRSQKAVVAFNNGLFSMDNIKRFIREKEEYEDSKGKKDSVRFYQEDFDEIHNVFSSAHQHFQPGNKNGFVKIERIDTEKKEERDEIIREKLIALIGDLKNRFAYRDIAILTRSNNEIERMTGWLLEEGITVESERTSDVRANFLIQELIALLQFLHSPIDNLAFTAFILGELFSKATGLPSQDMHDFVFSLRERLKKESDVYIYTEFRKRYEDVWTRFIDPFFKNVGLYPLYELVVSIYNTFECCHHFPEYQGFFMHFLELIKKQEEERSDIASFLEYFERVEGEDLFVHVSDSQAIQMMTIHKAKGLEFPVVILPFLGMSIQVGSSSEKQQSYILQHQEAGLELLRLKKKYGKFSGKLWEIYAREYKKSFLAELNNIYVALTRPRYELYAFVAKKVGPSINPVQFLIPEDMYEMGEQVDYPSEVSSDADLFCIPATTYPDWMGYLKDEFMDYHAVKNRTKRLQGEVTHYLFSFLGNLSQQDTDEQLKQALSEARDQFPQIENFSEYEERVRQLLEKEAVRPFFYCEDAQVFTEKEMVNAQGHTKRLDRLIVKSDEVVIVDYKSSHEGEEAHKEQMAEYEEMVSKMYPECNVSGHLLYFEKTES